MIFTRLQLKLLVLRLTVSSFPNITIDSVAESLDALFSPGDGFICSSVLFFIASETFFASDLGVNQRIDLCIEISKSGVPYVCKSSNDLSHVGNRLSHLDDGLSHLSDCLPHSSHNLICSCLGLFEPIHVRSKQGLRFFNPLHIGSKLSLLIHDKIHFSFDVFVVGHEELLLIVKQCTGGTNLRPTESVKFWSLREGGFHSIEHLIGTW